ncbi:hypothetical protein B2J93_4870 [Marssonina coronariae]|uniref:Uncharacterized protein n=1 Tax=Diplocarpon coronariae TaxID=2795749 RepID=A0A218Z916_9HELO|nr:hypothetical protein B2J93_4870 [Marssonina coronariae]
MLKIKPPSPPYTYLPEPTTVYQVSDTLNPLSEHQNNRIKSLVRSSITSHCPSLNSVIAPTIQFAFVNRLVRSPKPLDRSKARSFRVEALVSTSDHSQTTVIHYGSNSQATNPEIAQYKMAMACGDVESGKEVTPS